MRRMHLVDMLHSSFESANISRLFCRSMYRYASYDYWGGVVCWIGLVSNQALDWVG